MSSDRSPYVRPIAEPTSEPLPRVLPPRAKEFFPELSVLGGEVFANPRLGYLFGRPRWFLEGDETPIAREDLLRAILAKRNIALDDTATIAQVAFQLQLAVFETNSKEDLNDAIFRGDVTETQREPLWNEPAFWQTSPAFAGVQFAEPSFAVVIDEQGKKATCVVKFWARVLCETCMEGHEPVDHGRPSHRIRPPAQHQFWVAWQQKELHVLLTTVGAGRDDRDTIGYTTHAVGLVEIRTTDETGLVPFECAKPAAPAAAAASSAQRSSGGPLDAIKGFFGRLKH